MKTKKEQIIDEWKKTIVVHPSYRSIAKVVGVDPTYAFKVIKQHLQNKNKKKGLYDNGQKQRRSS
jgi:hypothetical protein